MSDSASVASGEATPYFLTTARLGFRRWTAADLPLALALWGDAEVMAFIDARGALTAEQVQERLARELATAETWGVQYWPVFLLDGGEFVGCAGLRPYRLDQGIYEIGFHLRRQHWGRGYAVEAALGVLSHAFRSLGARAVFAGHHPKNEASRRVLTRLGFRYTHDEFYPPTGNQHPCYLLRAEEFGAA
jgi:RimJ/RimL family protein N-acetyltransferase